MKREEKEGAAENIILLQQVNSYKLSTDKAEKDFEKLRKNVITQIRKTTDKNVKYKDMVNQKRKMKINLKDHHEFNVKITSLAYQVAICKLEIDIKKGMVETKICDTNTRLKKNITTITNKGGNMIA